MTLFAALCAYAVHHKTELDPQQMFYFLRGALYQWCIDHRADVVELENLFIQDIRYIAAYSGVHPTRK